MRSEPARSPEPSPKPSHHSADAKTNPNNTATPGTAGSATHSNTTPPTAKHHPSNRSSHPRNESSEDRHSGGSIFVQLLRFPIPGNRSSGRSHGRVRSLTFRSGVSSWVSLATKIFGQIGPVPIRPEDLSKGEQALLLVVPRDIGGRRIAVEMFDPVLIGHRDDVVPEFPNLRQ